MLLVCLIYSPWFDDAIDRSFPAHLRCETDKLPKMSQIIFVYVHFLHCGNKKDPRLREDDDGWGDDDGKAGKANEKILASARMTMVRRG